MAHGLAGDIIRFSNNTAGMEKILKFFIGVLILPSTGTMKQFASISHRASCKFERASKELSVARKVVKFLYVLDAGLKALEARKGPKGGPLKWFIVGKWACAFVYAASEAVTILHSMRVLSDAKSWWAKSANRKGNKFYFFSIVFSIAASAYQLWEITTARRALRKEKRKIRAHKHAMTVGTATAFANVHSSTSSSDSSDSSSDSSSESSSDEATRRRRKEQEAARRRALHQDGYPAAASPPGSVSSAASPTLNPAILSAEARLQNAAEWERKKLFVDAAKTSGTRNEEKPRTGPVVTQLLADVCDLAIPASKVGWYENKEAVGVAYLVSSLLAGSVIWGRVNASTTERSDRKGSHGGPIQMVKKETYNITVEEDKKAGRIGRTQSQATIGATIGATVHSTEQRAYSTNGRMEETYKKQGSSSSYDVNLAGSAAIAAGVGAGLGAGLGKGKGRVAYGGAWQHDESADGLHTTQWGQNTSSQYASSTHINGAPIQIVKNDVYDVNISGGRNSDMVRQLGSIGGGDGSIQVVKAEVYNTGVLEGRTGEIVKDLGLTAGKDGNVENPDALIQTIKRAKQSSDMDIAAGGTGQLSYTTTTTEGGSTTYKTTSVKRYEETQHSYSGGASGESASYYNI
ncbi:hypothetical protein ABW20_dc0100545 [Dactylellina cionopaga]|nr:hypothetical protein ABW20_dc0100545 [Dactylellina cionopaga]